MREAGGERGSREVCQNPSWLLNWVQSRLQLRAGGGVVHKPPRLLVRGASRAVFSQTRLRPQLHLLLSPDACRLQTLMKVEARLKKNIVTLNSSSDRVCEDIFPCLPLRAGSGRSFCLSLQTFCNNKLWQLSSPPPPLTSDP